MDAFNEALRGWQNFYFMMGGAAATLAGLMFVALSLGQHLIQNTRSQMKIFAMPSIIYFVSVLLLAGIMLVPIWTPTWIALVLFLSGGYGFVRLLELVRVLVRAARTNQDFTRTDWLSQVIGPVVSYALLMLAALFFVIDQTTLATIAISIATVVLLLCAITNTWSLVIWIVEQPRP